jgi:caa(3)-type oxidase subunit IV
MSTPPRSVREPGAMTYVLVWVVLAVLATVSLLLAQTSLGDWNVFGAFAIAMVKAMLVFAVFMHLAYGPPLHRLVIAVSIGFVVLVIAGVLADVGTRSVAGPYLGPTQGVTVHAEPPSW